jgi:NTP pyrophosphatase (non-canonical NTP hydrolase)
MAYGDYHAGHEPRIMHEEILMELARARAKFPRQNIWTTLAALTEEVGELNQDVLQFNHEPAKGKTKESIRKEAAQVAAMAMRVVLDCEPSDPRDARIASLEAALRVAREDVAWAKSYAVLIAKGIRAGAIKDQTLMSGFHKAEADMDTLSDMTARTSTRLEAAIDQIEVTLKGE